MAMLTQILFDTYIETEIQWNNTRSGRGL